MNKVITINLGGYPFTIDQDAYNYLERYLEVIHSHFRSSEGYEDIAHDIEVRIAELLQEYKGARLIVMLKDVKQAIAIMGKPEDFGAEPIEEETFDTAGQSKKQSTSKYRTGKRLFRDSDNQVIGGVCGGLAAYFGIPDPIWIRLAFIVFTLSGGFGVMLYIILWIIMPEAQTAADRLAMKGEDINVSSIARTIENQVNHLSGQLSELGSQAKKKTFSGEGGKEKIKGGVRQLGSAVKEAIFFLFGLLKHILVIVGVILLVILFGFWVTLLVFSVFFYPMLSFVSMNDLMAGISMINLIFLIGIPLLSLILLVFRLFFGAQIRIRWKKGLMLFWGINLSLLFLTGSFSMREYKEGANGVIANEDIVSADTLHVRMEQKNWDDDFFIGGDYMRLSGDDLHIEGVEMDIVKSTDGLFRIIQENKARGRDERSAAENAASIPYAYQLEDKKLIFTEGIYLPEGQKWRDQRVTLRLEVPEGKVLYFDGGWAIRNKVKLVDPNSGMKPRLSDTDRYLIMGPSGLH